MGERPCGQKREGFLLPHLPVSAVYEDQQWRPGPSVEVVEPVAFGFAVSQVELGRAHAAQTFAAILPACDNPSAAGDGGAIVVGRVKSRPVHVAIEIHHGVTQVSEEDTALVVAWKRLAARHCRQARQKRLAIVLACVADGRVALVHEPCWLEGGVWAWERGGPS